MIYRLRKPAHRWLSVCRDHRNGSSITKIPPDYRSFLFYSPLTISIILLSLSRNFEQRRKFTESPTYPSFYFMDHSFSNFFFIFVSFCENPEKNSRLTRYRSIKGLRHAPSPPSSPITITRSKTRISLKSLRIVRRVGGEERGKVWGRERGVLYETKPHYCKW